MAGDELEQLRTNARKRSELLKQRDELILQARAANVPVTHIAEAVNLSAMQVHRIIRGREP